MNLQKNIQTTNLKSKFIKINIHKEWNEIHANRSWVESSKIHADGQGRGQINDGDLSGRRCQTKIHGQPWKVGGLYVHVDSYTRLLYLSSNSFGALVMTVPQGFGKHVLGSSSGKSLSCSPVAMRK